MSNGSGPLVGLVILDGWGIHPRTEGNAIRLARTPVMDRLLATYPNATLTTCGEAVGLPAGQMGNSEVGHLNLGAGRIGYQDLTRIDKAVEDEKLRDNKILQETFAKAKNARLHFLGLVSDGGVHSSQEHLVALADAAHEAGVREIFVHAITDGRDSSPTGGTKFLAQVEKELKPSGGKIVTLI